MSSLWAKSEHSVCRIPIKNAASNFIFFIRMAVGCATRASLLLDLFYCELLWKAMMLVKYEGQHISYVFVNY